MESGEEGGKWDGVKENTTMWMFLLRSKVLATQTSRGILISRHKFQFLLGQK